MDEEDFSYDRDLPEYDDAFSDEMETGPDVLEMDEIDDRDDSPFENIPDEWAQHYDECNGGPEGDHDY